MSNFIILFLIDETKKMKKNLRAKTRDPLKSNIYFALFVLLRQKIYLHCHPLLRRHPSSSQPAAGGGGGGKDQFVIHLLAEKKRIVGNIGIPIVVRFCSI